MNAGSLICAPPIYALLRPPESSLELIKRPNIMRRNIAKFAFVLLNNLVAVNRNAS